MQSPRRKPIKSAGLPEEMDARSSPEQARRLGASLGVGGAEGAAAWANRKQAASAADDISPATSRGLLHGVLWCLAFTLIFVLGRLAVPALGAGWVVVAIVVMIPVSKWWSRRFGIGRYAASDAGDST